MKARIASIILLCNTFQSISAFVLTDNVRPPRQDLSTLFEGKEHPESEIHSLPNGSFDRRQFVTRSVSLGITAATCLVSSTEVKATSAETTTFPQESNEKIVDPRYFVAGGACAAISHGLATPFDVVKTKIQADPEIYDKGLASSVTSILQQEGVGVLLSGLIPTLIGFGVEGAVKFGVYESLKPTFSSLLHMDDNTVPFLAASVCAGAVACTLLCPMEKVRVKMVTQKDEDSDVGALLGQVIKEEGPLGIFQGFDAMLLKQIPYTMTKQVSFEKIASFLTLYTSTSTTTTSIGNGHELWVTVTSAFLASILACITSNPGDILVIKTFKERSTLRREGGALVLAWDVYEREGINGFFAGFSARLFHVVAIVTSQLVLYDFLKSLLGIPSTT